MCARGAYKIVFGCFKSPKGLKQLPHFQKLWSQFCLIKYEEDTFKNKLLNELISECNINHSKFLLHTYGKQCLIRLNFGTLQKHGLMLDHTSIAERLLSYLEPFPFDYGKLEEIKSKGLTIEKIRNNVEKQYLMWKYQVDEREIEKLLFKFKFCFYPFRSIRNLGESISILESMSNTKERSITLMAYSKDDIIQNDGNYGLICFKKTSPLSGYRIAEIIYLINQKPFSEKTVKKFKEKIVGLNWLMFPHSCLKILRHSHEYILFMVSFFKHLKFTDTQIRLGFPFLHLPFKHIIFRLNNLLGNPDLVKYRNEKFFLHLLYFTSQESLKLVNLSFPELLEIIRISTRSQTQSVTPNKVRQIVSQYYEIESRYFNIISGYSKFKLVSVEQMHDTLNFLKENKFTSKEVAESIAIILYSRNLISETLMKIKERKSALKKIGFNDDFVSEESNFFANGTNEKRKTLQLCLYYMEK